MRNRRCVGGESAASEVFAGGGAFGGAELLFEPGGGGFVEIEELAALAMLGGFFGEANSRLGRGTPHFCATVRTASEKPTFSIFLTKVKTSPCSWQPKQLKNWRPAWTEKEGVFSLWKGQRPLKFCAARLF